MKSKFKEYTDGSIFDYLFYNCKNFCKGRYYNYDPDGTLSTPQRDILYYLNNFEEYLIIDDDKLEFVHELVNSGDYDNLLIAAQIVKDLEFKE